MRNLYDALASENASLKDPTFTKMHTETKEGVASTTATINTLDSQIGKGKKRITPDLVDAFGAMVRERLCSQGFFATFLRHLYRATTCSLGTLFIVQKAFERQTGVMKTGKFMSWAVAAGTLTLLAQPVAAQNKERNKRPDIQSEVGDACKASVRSMSESTPQRKNDCQKTRRILM